MLLKSLMTLFERHFDVVLATSEQQLQGFLLRHKVFCEEKRFEPKQHSALEQDKYDPLAEHFLVRCRHTQEWVGYLRVVPYRRGLPCFRYVPYIADRSVEEWEHSVELSRLCVLPAYRGPVKQWDEDAQAIRDLPLVSIGLGVWVCRWLMARGKRDIYALTEPKMHSALNKLDVPIMPVSRLVKHKGYRAIYKLLSVDNIHDLAVSQELQGVA